LAGRDCQWNCVPLRVAARSFQALFNRGPVGATRDGAAIGTMHQLRVSEESAVPLLCNLSIDDM